MSEFYLVANVVEVAREALDAERDVVKREVKVLAAVDEKAERQAEHERKRGNDELEPAQIGSVLLARRVLDLDGAHARRVAHQAARVQYEHEQQQDEEQNGHRRPEQHRLQFLSIKIRIQMYETRKRSETNRKAPTSR